MGPIAPRPGPNVYSGSPFDDHPHFGSVCSRLCANMWGFGKPVANDSVCFVHMTVTLYAHPRGAGMFQNPGLYGNRTLTFNAPRLNPLLPPKPAPAKKNGLNFANPSCFFLVYRTFWRREPLSMRNTATSCFSGPNVGHFSPLRRLLLASSL